MSRYELYRTKDPAIATWHIRSLTMYDVSVDLDESFRPIQFIINVRDKALRTDFTLICKAEAMFPRLGRLK